MYKNDMALNNPKSSMCHKTQTNLQGETIELSP